MRWWRSIRGGSSINSRGKVEVEPVEEQYEVEVVVEL